MIYANDTVMRDGKSACILHQDTMRYSDLKSFLFLVNADSRLKRNQN